MLQLLGKLFNLLQFHETKSYLGTLYRNRRERTWNCNPQPVYFRKVMLQKTGRLINCGKFSFLLFLFTCCTNFYVPATSQKQHKSSDSCTGMNDGSSKLITNEVERKDPWEGYLMSIHMIDRKPFIKVLTRMLWLRCELKQKSNIDKVSSRV